MAGFVDAAGYISLGHIYTANMSGNSVAIGVHAVSGEWAETLRRLWPVVAYFGGLLFYRLLITYGARRRIHRIATPALSCEIGLLLPACLTAAGGTVSGPPVAYVGLLATAHAAARSGRTSSAPVAGCPDRLSGLCQHLRPEAPAGSSGGAGTSRSFGLTRWASENRSDATRQSERRGPCWSLRHGHFRRCGRPDQETDCARLV
jgi:hypothetical protein